MERFREFVKGLPKMVVITARQAGPSTGEIYPDDPLVIDYVDTIRIHKMTSEELLSHLRADLDKYAPDCQESVKRNSHMNEYDGHVRIVNARPFLDGFCERFASRYMGSQSTGDVATGMVHCARVWRYAPKIPGWENGLDHSDQDTRDAVLTDFINFAAGRRGVDFALCSKDLKVKEPGDEVYR